MNNITVESTFKLLLDKQTYQSKPTDIKAINKRIVQCPTQIDVVEFSKQITSPNSRTWIPAYLEGGRKNENWKHQQIFALDFDNGITFNQVFLRLKEYGLDCTFAYETFSSTPEKPKFRLIWQLNQVVIERAYRDRIQLALMLLFPESDKACKDACRLFFGGKNLLYTNYDYFLDLSLLMESSKCYAVRNSSSQNLRRDLDRVDKKLGESRKGKKWKKNGNDYIYNIETSRFPPNLTSSELLKVDWDDLRSKVRILDDFLNGEWLYHPQLFGLATNFIYIHGGTQLFKECLDLNSNYSSDKYHLPSIAKHYNYHPARLENFSSYEDDHAYVNLLEASRKQVIKRMKHYQTMSLSEAEQNFKTTFEQVLASNDTNVHVFKVVTGLGKTEECLALEGITLALPNHDLKNEIEGRFKVDCLTTPALPDDLPDKVKATLDYYYSIGALTEATRYILNESKTNKALDNYRKKVLNCYSSRKTVLTTHQKALFVDFTNHSTVIFDEDPISSVLSIGSTTISDFYRLKGQLNDPSDRKAIEDYIQAIETGLSNSPIATKVIGFNDYKELEDEILSSNIKFDGNILHFFDSDWFVVDASDKATIYFIKHQPLPAHKKVIILSATANENIYKQLVGDRLHFYDLSNVELPGVIEQDTKYSYSRTSLAKQLDYVQPKVENLPVITFAQFKHQFDKAVKEAHFGKCTGFNNLKGQDIAVIGTPHINPITYLLYAQVLELKFKPSDFRMHTQVVNHNGFQFLFKTYDNEDLRNLQFFFIESELVQATGRARSLRNPVVVKLFSNYPLPEAAIGESENAIAQKKLEVARARGELEKSYLGLPHQLEIRF